MAKRVGSWWIPVAALLSSAVLAIFAGPSLGAFTLRMQQSATGTHYYCVRYCEPGGEVCETQESEVPLSKEDGWECWEQNPVNFLTGANSIDHKDLETLGLSRFSVTRMHLQDPGRSDHGLGPCWRIGWLYRLVQNGTSVSVIGGNTTITSFTDNGNGTFTPHFNYVTALTTDSLNHLLILTDARGKQWKFFDFSGSWNPARQGRLKEFDDRAGNVTTTTYGTSGVTQDQLLEVQQTDPNPAFLHRFAFSYNLSGASIGLLASITYSRTVSGITTTVRVANYTYYTSSGPNGPAGTLQRVRIADASANVLDTCYYRYDAMDGGGFVPLRIAVNPHSYERLLAALGSDAAIDAASDTTLSTYSDFFFLYDAQHRVIQETVQGKGCGCGTSGSRGVYSYAYGTAAHGQPDGPNVWRFKCTVTLPDGNQRIVFTNSAGQTMADVTKDVTSGQQWIKYFVFNTDASLAAIAFPSAVTGFSEAAPELVSSAQLPDGSGLWHLFTYYSTTDLPNGAVAKFRSSRLIRQGETGTPILIETTKFTSRTGAVGTIYPLASRTVYRNDDGSGARTATFGYTWQGTSTEVLQKTATFPIVPTNQNGSGSATSMTAQLDAFGRQVWFRDEDGFIHAAEYDTLTGAETKRIVDVNTALVTNEPAGWVTPAGGGLHLVTTFRPDLLGRDTKTTDPLGIITFTVYLDTQHEVRAYPGWNTTTNLPTGPTQLSREDRVGNYNERLTMSATPAVTGGEPTGAEAVSGLQSLLRNHLDTGDRTVHADSYFNFSGLTYSTSPALGTQGVHFYRRDFNYDTGGRRDRDADWTGTITRAVYDSHGRVKSTWIGTDDTPTTGDWSPTNTAGTNLNKISENEWDGNGIGNDTLTRSKLYTSVVTTLDTVFQYDFRNRETHRRGPDNVAVKKTYDNLDEAVLEETFADGDQNFVIGATELRGKAESKFDEKRRAYQTILHHVNPSTGVVGNRLTTNAWSDGRGNRIKTRDSNGLFSKASFDGAGRVKAIFISYHDAETLYADADDVVGDTVIDETVTTYDAASNVIQTTHYERTSTTAKLGDLSVSWAAAQSRRMFKAQWFDKANRLTDAVDYGDNGGANLTRPPTPPAPNSSDNTLVTHFEYDSGGRPFRITDNKARIMEQQFDGLSRVTKTIQNRADGTPVETELDTDRTTEFVFDSSGRLSQVKAHNPKGSGAGVELQTTQFAYGTIANEALPAVFRNDVLAAEIHADSDDTFNPAGPAGSQLGNGTDTVYDRQEFTYDYASRKLTFKDQRQTLRTMNYDAQGRLQSDAVTTLGAGVDGSIRRIESAYDSLSRLLTVTSYDAPSGGSPINQVKYTYDGWGNDVICEQAHQGTVVGGTPSYQIATTDGAVGGEAKFIRTSSWTYPNGRIVHANYPAAATVGDRLERVDNLANDPSGTSKFSQYTYLGIGTIGRIDHPLVTNGLRREVATGGNPAEWDRFGRILDERWKRSGATFNYDRYQHTYDRASNRLSRNVTPNSPPAGRDEFYAYDGLDRLIKLNRGTLSGGQITDANANFSQNWSALESQGNWRTSVEDTNGGAAGGATTQTRTHTKANEVATVSGNTPDWIDPVHDLTGNMTSGPQPGNEGVRIHLSYDAWSRLAKVQADSGGSPGATIAEYQYDGRNRRTVKLKPNGLNWDRRDYYYTCRWQSVEERELLNTASKTVVATVPKYQWIWDLRYIDAVLLRDENKDGDGDCVDGTDQRLFYTQDANFNTTALVEIGGSVVERYVYDPYGKVSVLTGTWTAQSPTVFNNEMLFTGERLDPETGLYYFKNRYYSPSLGRFISRDPLDLQTSTNLYEYVRSRVTQFVDPYGLEEQGAPFPSEQDLGVSQQDFLRDHPDIGTYGEDWTIIGPPGTHQNCFGYSCGLPGWWQSKNEPTAPVPTLWPEGGERGAPTVDKYDWFYKKHGFNESKNCDPECDKIKVALYALTRNGQTRVTHAAKQDCLGGWISKMGMAALIQHKTLKQLEGPAFGKVLKCYEKARKNCNPHLCPCRFGEQRMVP